MGLLSKQEYLATFGETRSQLPPGQVPPFDFWPYFDSIPEEHFLGHDCSEGIVEWAWRDGAGQWEHVLINSEDRNVFMVLVLDLRRGVVHGHRLLDLNHEYGLDE